MQNHRAAVAAAYSTSLSGKRRVAIQTAPRQGLARGLGSALLVRGHSRNSKQVGDPRDGAAPLHGRHRIAVVDFKLRLDPFAAAYLPSPS